MGAKKPYVVAFLIQATYAGNVLLSKAAFNAGMSTFVFVFYRQFAGTLFLLPFAIVFERKSPNPLSMAIFCKIFMLAFLGITLSLNVYGVALVYTSANLGATTINCLPVTTFAFAVLLGMEKVNIRTAPGIAKVAGIVVCMAGVAVLAFYKGAHLKPLVHHGLEFGHGNRDHHDHVSSAKRMLGCFLLLVSSMCWGLWLVLQGILVTGLAYYLQTWVVSMKGPVFLAMTTPLCLIMTILGSMFVLGEVINLGSVLGGVLLVISLYSVLWGKSKEERMENQLLPVQDEEKSTDLKETEASIAKPTSLAQNM
ncbi:WAT1-related protein At5g64700-like isoform X2 [Durio zibethinus]|uniref:WAT1-related protein n=1 Tax=Durio zibethinus TaxID=66656 RepID=A0A6P5YJX6_DURZI|nr:WAT1-related protein At5g64700-like isoform X2 [Durio zibethinus]